METIDNGAFDHDEADITIISYICPSSSKLWKECNFCVCPVSILGPDGVLGWGTVLDINATCSELGPQCLQLLGMHTLSGCDTTSNPYSKGKARALNTLLSGNFPGLADIVGEVNATQVELMEAVKPFFTALYNQVPGTSMESARFNLFYKEEEKSKNYGSSSNIWEPNAAHTMKPSTSNAVESSKPPSPTCNIRKSRMTFLFLS